MIVLRVLNLNSNPEDSDHLAAQFRGITVQSLRKLDIHTVYEVLWCVCVRNLSIIHSTLLVTRTLVRGIVSSQVDLDFLLSLDLRKLSVLLSSYRLSTKDRY